MNDVVVVIATHDREQLLLHRAVASVAAQMHSPIAVLIVNDGAPLTTDACVAIANRLGPRPVEFIENQRTRGYAGTLNTALLRLAQQSFAGFVAVLDDDDTWDAHHLQLNFGAATSRNAHVVVSGLRLIKDGKLVARPLLHALKSTDFFSENPGWQGSNTFVRMASLMEAGGFREGLVSCNDRDLAIRLLRLPNIRIAFTGEWTSSWHLEQDRPALSHSGSYAKLAGLRGFWTLHHAAMNPDERALFFSQARERFGFTEEVLLAPPPHPLRLLASTPP